MQPIPVDTVGELYIGGAGLARGYLNNPELTKERFVPNPFATEDDKAKGYTRLYKTGDLVRWLPDGNIEYIGRNDFQVKIRGFRIELSDIESSLESYPQTKKAVVLKDEIEGESRLIAFVEKEDLLTISGLRNFLKESLPDYMLPHRFIMIDNWPYTSSGKVDRKFLAGSTNNYF